MELGQELTAELPQWIYFILGVIICLWVALPVIIMSGFSSISTNIGNLVSELIKIRLELEILNKK